MYIGNRRESQLTALPDILRVAQRLGAKLKKCNKGGKAWAGPCPRCGGTDRFAISVTKQLFNCRGAGVGGDVIDMVKYLQGTTYLGAIKILTGDIPHAPRAVGADAIEDRKPSQLAIELFHEAEDLAGTPAAVYLAARGIPIDKLPDRIGEALRWHPSCVWGSERRGAMLGLFTDALTGEPMSVHRTAISQGGQKVARAYLGPKAGCVIRLWPDIGQTLIIGEGVETVLSAATFSYRGEPLTPAWAAGDAGNLAGFPVIKGVERLVVLVDRDANGRGQEAAGECAHRWRAAGRKVVRLIPRKGKDFNDLVKEI
jgi:phage/plasmid primase-like uncharacterized protein